MDVIHEHYCRALIKSLASSNSLELPNRHLEHIVFGRAAMLGGSPREEALRASRLASPERHELGRSSAGLHCLAEVLYVSSF